MSSNNRQEFEIALKDLYSSRLDQISVRSDKAFASINRDINSVGRSSRNAAASISDIDRRLDALRRARSLTIDLTAIKAANREIKILEATKNRLEGGSDAGMMGGIGKFAAPVALGAAAFGIGRGIANFVGDGAKLAMINEQNAVSFEVMLGSATKADDMLNKIAKFSAATPFQKLEITDAAQSLLGYGVNANSIMPTMQMLGDVSRGNSEVFKRVTENYGKAVSAQRMRTEDINQFAEAGIPMWAELEKITGKSGQALRKYVENNGISVDQMNQAFASMTGEGGKFHGMMQKQSQTTTGRLSTLKDNVDEVKMAMGERLKPTMDALVDVGGSVVKMVGGWMEIPVSQQLAGQKAEMNALVRSITDYNMGEDQRKRALAALQEKYPEYFSNIDIEKAKNEELLGILSSVNDQYDRKIDIASRQSIMDKLKEDEAMLQQEQMRIMTRETAEDMYRKTGNTIYRDLANQQRSSLEKIATGAGFGLLFAGGENVEDVNQRLEQNRSTQLMEQIGLNISQSKDNYIKLQGVIREYAAGQDEATAKYFQGSTQAASKFLTTYTQITNKLRSGGKNVWSAGLTSEIQGLIDELNNPGGENNSLGVGATGTGGLSSGITDISGDRVAQKNVTININNLIEGGFSVSTTNLTEGAAQSQEIVVQALLNAVNDANYVAG